jgi:hypothetical protein
VGWFASDSQPPVLKLVIFGPDFHLSDHTRTRTAPLKKIPLITIPNPLAKFPKDPQGSLGMV